MDTGEGIKEFGVGAIGGGEGAGQEGLAHARRAKAEDVEVLADPVALGQLENETTV